MKKLYTVFARLATIIGFPITALVLHGSRRVRVVILAENHILLQRTSIGTQKWSLPGGGVEKGEDDATAAVREVAEEVGLSLEPAQLKYLGEDYRASAGHTYWPKFTRAYLLAELPKRTKPKIVHPLEILEVGWFPLTALPEADKQTLESAFKFLEQRKK